MKRFIFTIAASLFVMNAFAQPGYFIHKVYEPMVVELTMFTPYYFDITGDSILEFYFEQSRVAIENDGHHTKLSRPRVEIKFLNLNQEYDEKVHSHITGIVF